VVLDEQDMGGPAALADFERITRAGPMALFVVDGKWHWAGPDDATRVVADSGGQQTKADAYSPLDVMALAKMTRARSIRFGLVYGQSASRRRGEPFSTEIIFKIEGETQDGARTRKRYELIHPKGQAPLTALGVSLALERLIGLDGRTPVGQVFISRKALSIQPMQCVSAWNKGSDSDSMILRGVVALVCQENQLHGQQLAFVVPDPGRLNHRWQCRARWRYRRLGSSEGR
jgi:hypothetical protein